MKASEELCARVTSLTLVSPTGRKNLHRAPKSSRLDQRLRLGPAAWGFVVDEGRAAAQVGARNRRRSVPRS